MILAKNIHKFYDNNHILKGIDINVNKGEIISLVGASGAGKSTLLQILGTIDNYDKKESSTLLLNNHDVSIMSDDELARFRNQEIGFVFQFHQLLPEFTAIENICIPAFINKTPKKIAETTTVAIRTSCWESPTSETPHIGKSSKSSKLEISKMRLSVIIEAIRLRP